MLPYPVVFVPGITASTLRDYYPIPPEYVWSLIVKKYDRLALHPSDLRFEAQQPAMVRSEEVFELAYEEMIEDLRDELSNEAGDPVPVFPFAYDWRQPLEMTQARLAAFVDEVLDRTRLMPHYRKKYGDELKVNLVGHSMGGLLITRCLSDQPQPLPVAKVVTLATPFRGSFEAIVKLAIGVGNLGKGKPSHSERRASRVTPALYQLLPSFAQGIEIDPSLPQQLLDPVVWQDSMLESLKKFIKDLAIPGDSPADQAVVLFTHLLELARRNARAVQDLDLARHGLAPSDWLAVVGVDTDTRVRVAVKLARGKPRFEFDHKVDVRNHWDSDDPAEQRRTGDGTVPYEGAVPPFLPEDQLVLVVPDDYGFWEIGDKALTELGGFHGILPNMNMVQRLVMRFLTDGRDRYGNTWGRPAPGVERWNPPLRLKQRS